MTQTREDLLTRMIRIYGMESPIIIDFAALLENTDIPDELLEAVVVSHEDRPITEEEEEE